MTGSASAAVGLVTFGFINLVLFIVLSAPFGTLTDLIEEQADSDHLDVQSGDIKSYLDTFKTVFGLSFVLSMVGLIVWFFLGTHKTEHEQY